MTMPDNGLHPQALSREFLMAAVSDIDSISIEQVGDTGLLLWDDEDAKMLPVNFLERMGPEALTEKIYISKDIPDKFQVDKTALAEYLWSACDKNTFITMDSLVVMWSEPDVPDTFEPSDFADEQARRMYEEFGDEYAYEIGGNLLGQLWFERNIAVVNMGEIARTAMEIEEENSDLSDYFFSLENQVYTGFLTTAIHELRHLQMETNIFLPQDIYPLSLNSEEEVEQYCRDAFENSKFRSDIFPGLFSSKERSELTKEAPFMEHMEKFDLSSVGAISQAAEQAQRRADAQLNSSIPNEWAQGYAAALKDVAEQMQPSHRLMNDLLNYLGDHFDNSELYRMLHDDLDFTDEEISFLGFLDLCFQDSRDDPNKVWLEELIGESISDSEFETLFSLMSFDAWTIVPGNDPRIDPIKNNLRCIRDPENNASGLAFISPEVKVEWVNLNEGWNGDYDPNGPTDENLLRFDVYVLRGGAWEVVDNTSHCTAFPASATLAEKAEALQILGKAFDNALSKDIDVSVKRLAEQLSHISPADLPSNNIPLEDKLRGAVERASVQKAPETEHDVSR